MHKTASRFRKVINVLKPILLDAECVRFSTLKLTTRDLGEFYIYYWSGDDNGPAHYKVWITSDKSGPAYRRDRVELWKRPRRSILGKWTYFRSPSYVPVFKAYNIRTLRSISMDIQDNTYRIVAWLDDQWLHSETNDLLRTVKVLEEIYAGM